MNAAWLSPPPRPPHDPLRLRLDRRAGWRAAPALIAGVETAADDGALRLSPLPGSGRLLAEASGSFGGLAWPTHLAPLGDDGLALIDVATRRLYVLDACRCHFVPWPCVTADDPRLPVQAAGIAWACDQLLVCDPAAKRIVVLHPRTGAVRAVWPSPPIGDDITQAWTPVAAAARRREILVADPANGGVHVLAARGAHRRFLGGLGAVRAIAVDAHGGVYLRLDGAADVVQIDPGDGRVIAHWTRPAQIAARFAPLPVTIYANGAADVSRYCAGDATLVVDIHGEPLAAPPAEVAESYAAGGTWTSASLDSEIAHCTWDRVDLCASLPAGTTIDVLALTSEDPIDDATLAALPDEYWTHIGTWRAGARDGAELRSSDWMLRCPRGRLLRLRLALGGDGKVTPRIGAVEIDFPRISLRRYLPQVFGAEPVSAEFLDRWLAIFDHEFRAIEALIDNQAGWFDPLSAPTGDRRCDFLRFIASWVGVTLEQGWPEARRRAFLKGFPRLFPRRGTVGALRDTLYLFLGLERWAAWQPVHAACVPCGSKVSGWRPPRLILEHYQLRRWMLLGHARLSDNARLWGERIAGRSRLADPNLRDADGARLGATALDASRDPARDIFHLYAHRLSIFLPAARVRSPSLAGALARLVAAESPAHVKVDVIRVEPRFRVGVQAALGLDAVIGWRPRATALDLDALGRATVLGGREESGQANRIGAARAGMQTIL